MCIPRTRLPGPSASNTQRPGLLHANKASMSYVPSRRACRSRLCCKIFSSSSLARAPSSSSRLWFNCSTDRKKLDTSSDIVLGPARKMTREWWDGTGKWRGFGLSDVSETDCCSRGKIGFEVTVTDRRAVGLARRNTRRSCHEDPPDSTDARERSQRQVISSDSG